MFLRLREHLKFANVVSVIALFLALGGGAYAAINLPKNSVSSKHIVNGQVKRVDIAKNAVNSGKVANFSLLADDFKAGQLPAGPAGPKGDTGLQGPKGDKGDIGDTGPQGDTGPAGTVIAADITQTSPVASGTSEATAASVPLTGDLFTAAPDGIGINFPSVTVTQPSTCTGDQPRLHLQWYASGFLLARRVVEFKSWIPSGYALDRTGEITPFVARNPLDTPFEVDEEIKAWDTCTGPSERWTVNQVDTLVLGVG